MRDLKLSIAQKLFLSFLLTGTLSLFTISILFYRLSREALLNRTFNQLASINTLKKKGIENYILDKEESLLMAMDNKIFDNLIHHSHQFSSDYLNSIRKKLNFLDLLVFNQQGEQIIYQLDSTTYNIPPSFITEPSLDQKYLDNTSFSDKKNTFVFLRLLVPGYGSIVAVLNFDDIQNILQERTGLGKTGETYLIGTNDTTMLSQSRFWVNTKPSSISVNTKAVIKTMNGEFDPQVVDDYRKVPVLSVARSFNLKGLNWIIFTNIGLSEALEPMKGTTLSIVIIMLVGVWLVLGITWYLSTAIAHPITKLNQVIQQMSQGIFPVDKLDYRNSDEIGQMAESIYKLIEGLRIKTNFSDQIGSGNLESDFEPLSNSDELGKALLIMRNKLRALRKLEKETSLQKTSTLIKGQEQERNRIARELHDGLGQILTVTRLRTGKIRAPRGLREELKNLVDEAIKEVRKISNNVMPFVLVDFGLEAALNKLAQDIQAFTKLKITVSFSDNDPNKVLNFESTVNIYRVIQESVNNIIKHAAATLVEINIKKESNDINISIIDNGKGFNLESKLNKGGGIENMQERIEMLKGNLSIDTKPNLGTKILIYVPSVYKI